MASDRLSFDTNRHHQNPILGRARVREAYWIRFRSGYIKSRTTCLNLSPRIRDVSAIRGALEDIANSVEEASPRPPRFRGKASPAFGGATVDLQQGTPGTALDVRTDFRKASALFEELDDACADEGIEALAWYHPFHLSRTAWGIYIPLTSIHYGADRWFNHRIGLSNRTNLAFQALFEHELTHFSCEYAVAQYELFLRATCWLPARERLKAAGLKWFNDEEALANASSVRQLRLFSPKVDYGKYESALRRSPEGYRDYECALDDVGFEDYAMEVLRHNVGIPALDLETGFLNDAFQMLSLFPDNESAKGVCPLYFIEDDQDLDVTPLFPKQVSSIPEIIESKKFKKMLIKLDNRRQSEWLNMKMRLAKEVPRYPAFKMLKGKMDGIWGVYLGEGFRAHIRRRADGVWEALEIGTHNAMGHG